MFWLIFNVLANVISLVPIVFGSDCRHFLYLQYLRNTLRLTFEEGVQMLKVRFYFPAALKFVCVFPVNIL